MIELALIQFLKSQEVNKPSRNRKTFNQMLSSLEKKRRARKIPRGSLHTPENSAWRKVLSGRSDGAMITLTGVDHVTFNMLHDKFCPLYNTLSPHNTEGILSKIGKPGRRRVFSSWDCLGLCLAWTRTRGGLFMLSMMFGITSSGISLYIRFGRRLMIEVLRREESAKVKIPSDEKICEYKECVRYRHPKLSNVWMTMDGLKLQLEQSPKCEIQNRFYNGWTHDHYETNIFGFAPSGTIVVATTNVPGCVHDSTVCEWGNIYKKLGKVYERTGAMVTVDSAFCRKNHEYLIKSSNTLPCTAEEIHINDEATSMRQSAEWGMRSFQASFPRIKDRIIYEEKGERKLILEMLVYLFNFRANKVGISQIKNTYLTPLLKEGNSLL